MCSQWSRAVSRTWKEPVTSQIYLYRRLTGAENSFLFPLVATWHLPCLSSPELQVIPLMLRSTSPLPPSSLFSQLQSRSNGLCTSHRCSSFVSYLVPAAIALATAVSNGSQTHARLQNQSSRYCRAWACITQSTASRHPIGPYSVE